MMNIANNGYIQGKVFLKSGLFRRATTAGLDHVRDSLFFLVSININLKVHFSANTQEILVNCVAEFDESP